MEKTKSMQKQRNNMDQTDLGLKGLSLMPSSFEMLESNKDKQINYHVEITEI